MPTIDEQIQILKRRCERIVPEDELRSKLKRSAETSTPLRIKLGMDPTAPDVTLGHAVPLRVVRQFQEWGHKAVLIIGDYTARIGDPTGRNKTRPPLSGEEIDRNARTYTEQIGKVLLTDPRHLEVRHNGEWLAQLNLMDVIRLTSRRTVAQVLTREDFAKRYAEGAEIRMHEILYPLMQGFDSVMINADIEMGGSDQLFNNLVGRDFQQEDNPGDPLAGQVVIVTPLLVGTDGSKKMSKSLGNYISVTEPPREMFGKIMSLPDSLLLSYYTLLTDLPREEFEPLVSQKPRDAKVALARHIITWLHDAQSAEYAEREFNKIFREGGVPDEMPEFTVGAGPHKLPALLVAAGLAASNSEATRKIREGAVSLDGQKVNDPQQTYTIQQPTVLRLGRKFARVTPA